MNDFEIEMLNRIEKSHWWFQIRKRILSDWAKTFPDFATLDVGSGVGGNTQLLIDMGFKVTSVESSLLGVNYQISKGIPAIHGDICSLPFDDGAFRNVVCLDVLEHVFNDVKALGELHRVLAEGGQLLISVPEDPEMYSEFDKKVLHHRRYTKELLDSRLRFVGLEVSQMWSTNWFLKPIVKFLRRRGYLNDFGQINPLLNYLLFLISQIDYFFATSRVSGMTIWVYAYKPISH